MSFTWVKDKVVKTRKPHWCLGCREDIKVGASARSIFCVEDSTGGGSQLYLCTYCSDYIDRHRDVWGEDPAEGVNYGFINEYKHERPYSVAG